MRAPRPWDRTSRVALVALMGAGVLVVAATIGAWHIDPWPSSFPEEPIALGYIPTKHDSSATLRAVLAGTEQNPFRPDRQRPAIRYRLPSERVARVTSAPARLVRTPSVRLVGIAHVPGGSGLAALAVSGQAPRLVRVGQVIEGFIVRAVDRSEVTLVGADTTFTLKLPDPGAPASGSNGQRRQ